MVVLKFQSTPTFLGPPTGALKKSTPKNSTKHPPQLYYIETSGPLYPLMIFPFFYIPFFFPFSFINY